ncbi:MAG TPA: xanthine dehydrogenase family protein subunit M [Candidatus Elarobacter sp.]|nr:xanthine dehydrogenase family protein subunit M [Candidatus Elarobacter sp.]
MFPAPFDYHRPGSLDETLALLAQYGGDARVLAGGQSLIPAMRFRLARPAVLIDINQLADLGYIRETDGVLALGAIARDAALEHSSLIASSYRLLADTSALVADPIVRQTGTVVGSLCHNDPSGDWGVTALASRAQIVIRGKGGTRTVPIDEFLVDSFATAVGEGELALEVRFPKPPDRTSGSYQKIERKVGDFATACAAAQITLAADGTVAEVGIAIGAAGPTAMRVKDAENALRGSKPSKDAIRAAADEARKLADPVADTRGSAEFKKDMAGVLVRRALVAACERLGVGGMQ